jgi:hypothetical protein
MSHSYSRPDILPYIGGCEHKHLKADVFDDIGETRMGDGDRGATNE